MTRINDRLLIQKVEADVVVMDEVTGTEITVPERRVFQLMQEWTVLTAALTLNPDAAASRADVGPTLVLRGEPHVIELVDFQAGEEIRIRQEDWGKVRDTLHYFSGIELDAANHVETMERGL